MAAILQLPAHADIHEFSVMFTNDVRKKAKNWHDGYLKWHTFNFRAILYDAQRKVVSSEFFPNRTINANTDIDFSNAMVQVGDQLETLQANLEHVYRKDHRPTVDTSSAVLSVQNTPAQAQPLQSPNIPRSIQKRVYPTSAAHGMSPLCCLSTPSRASRKAKTSELSKETPPVTKIARRSIGIVRQTPAGKPSPATRQSPLAASRMNPMDFQREALQPGWFAREDLLSQRQSPTDQQSAASDREVCKQTSKQASRKRSKPEIGPNVANPITVQKKTTREPSVTVIDSSTGNEGPKASRTPSESSSGLQAECIDSATTQSADSGQEHASGSKKSRLDPTRTTIKPKPRTFLAARRRKSTSVEPPGARAPAPYPPVSSSKALKVQGVHARMSVADSVPAPSIEDVIYDADTNRWVPDNLPDPSRLIKDNAKTSLTVVPSRQESESSAKDNYDMESISHQNTDCERQSDPSSTCGGLAYQKRTMAKLSALLATDDDGFMTEIIKKSRPQNFRPVLPPRRRVANRAAIALVETFRCSPEKPTHIEEEPQRNSIDTEARTRQVSPLFMPDSSQDSTSDKPGVLTQIAARAATDIAKRSSIRRIGPSALARKPLHPKLHLQTLARKDHVGHKVSKTSTVPKSSSRPADIVQSPALPSNIELRTPATEVRTDQASQTTIDALFPATPVNLETEDLDTVFASHEEALSHSEKRAPEDKEQEVTGVKRKRDEPGGGGGTMLATQLNTRAPDFMTAKSFSRGSILRLDETMPSVGLSSRQLDNLDAVFPSQLSG